MAETTNLISIAPVQPKASAKMTSQSTQPKYKSATRAGKKSFGATLDKINAKLDELKQGIKDLQDTNQENVQVDPDAEKNNTAEKIPAQGKSKQPQEATQKAIRNEEVGSRNNAELIAEEDGKPADIFLGENQSATNILAANSMAYLFAMNSESLLTAKPVIDSAAVEVSKVEGVQEIQNLQTLLPQSDNNNNAQSMLQMLGGKTWRVFDNQLTVQTPLVENQPVQIQTAQPTLQAQLVENQPAQVQSQPIAQVVENQPAQVQSQPTAQFVENQPAQIQSQPTAQVVENQPAQVQSQPIAQIVENQPAQVQSQPIAQIVEHNQQHKS